MDAKTIIDSDLTEVDKVKLAVYLGNYEAERLQERIERLEAELSAVDEALGEFYCPVVDGSGNHGGSFFKDHGVHLALRRIADLEQQNALLQAQVRTAQTSVVADTVERQQATIRRLQAELERAQPGEPVDATLRSAKRTAEG